ncbi:PREDICTED: BAG domain-containing protein Samui-like isoform X2 [Nicrophorus vespilloides]|uniref:BAG domain-containing protein Samui-like isoform X2 n=1 Tax=Nicrophorus vespilloides TaxID=110193 RepID=A0ABM1NJ92_NICVS|nr:PREDICTED: BAG domain-containing protein Samui-like isoform X2 [Nicrophorus vespilloides]
MPFSRQPFTGFPFDDRDDRDNRFSQLDDIASRFPEFADHLSSFQEARRPRRTSGSSDSSWSDPFNRFTRFGSRFPRRFPDDPDFFPEHYQTHQTQQQTHPEPAHQQQQQQQYPQQQQQYSQQQQYPQQQQQYSQQKQPPQQQEQQQQPAPPPEAPKEPVPENKGDQVDGETTQQRANLQQSNTVDLGQKQEPVDDNRNQRSMSAPPENRPNLFGRFVSSINIPNLNPEPDMGSRMSSQPEQPQQKQSTERIIPIHVEGRDEPVAPKNVQPETIFGQMPSQFTQFINREPDHEDVNKQKAQPEEHVRQVYRDVQQEQPKHRQQEQQQPQEPEHKEPPKKATPLDLIQNIQKDVNELMSQVERFEGKPRDKQYLYLDEMLTRNLLKLDNIETEGKDTIRQARKMAIRCIEECIKVLENKAANNLKAMQQDKPAEEEAQPKPEEQQTADKQSEIEAIPALPPPAEFSNMETDKTEEKPVDVKETPAVEEPKSETKPTAEEPKPEVSQTEESQSFEKKKARKKSDKK